MDFAEIWMYSFLFLWCALSPYTLMKLRKMGPMTWGEWFYSIKTTPSNVLPALHLIAFLAMWIPVML